MEDFDVKNYVIYRAFAKNIVDELSIHKQKLCENALKSIDSYEKNNKKIETLTDIYEVGSVSKKIDEEQNNLIFLLSALTKIDKLINRNNERIHFFDLKIESEKVTKFEVSKKQLQSQLENSKIKISNKLLNINSNDNYYAYYNDDIFEFKNGEFSFECERNYEILSSYEDNDFAVIINRFPKCLITITDEQLLDIKFKNMILKYFFIVANDNLKGLTMNEINEYFNYPLVFDTYTPKNIKEYIEKIQNLFNVRTKIYLLNKYPSHKNEINSKLICDDYDETLPEQFLHYSLEEDDENEDDVFTDEDADAYVNHLIETQN